MKVDENNYSADGANGDVDEETPSPSRSRSNRTTDKRSASRRHCPSRPDPCSPFRAITKIKLRSRVGCYRSDVMSVIIILTRPIIPPPPSP